MNISWEANRFSDSQKFPAFYGTQRFITAFTSARHLSLSGASSIQSIPPHRTSQRSILHYPPTYVWVSQVVSFPQVSPPNPVYACPLPRRATCPAHLIYFDFITRTILAEECRSLNSSLCSFIHCPVTSSLLGPNILNTLFSNTLSLRSSLNVSDQVSHPYKTAGKIIVLYIFKFLYSKSKDKRYCTEW